MILPLAWCCCCWCCQECQHSLNITFLRQVPCNWTGIWTWLVMWCILFPRQAKLGSGGIMLSGCPFFRVSVRPFVRSFVCYQIGNAIFWKRFWCMPIGTSDPRARAWKRSTLGIRMSKVKVTWGPRWIGMPDVGRVDVFDYGNRLHQVNIHQRYTSKSGLNGRNGSWKSAGCLLTGFVITRRCYAHNHQLLNDFTSLLWQPHPAASSDSVYCAHLRWWWVKILFEIPYHIEQISPYWCLLASHNSIRLSSRLYTTINIICNWCETHNFTRNRIYIQLWSDGIHQTTACKVHVIVIYRYEITCWYQWFYRTTHCIQAQYMLR